MLLIFSVSVFAMIKNLLSVFGNGIGKAAMLFFSLGGSKLIFGGLFGLQPIELRSEIVLLKTLD